MISKSDEIIRMAVVGSSSMVGSRFCEMATADLTLVKADLHSDIPVDITQRESVDNFFETNEFNWIILFAAFTNVDAAEKQRGDKKDACWQINVAGTGNIVDACLRTGRKLIFISTDFVFDGTSGPNSEDSPIGPNFSKISWYGITKVEAEKTIKEKLSDYLILRIAYPYRGRFESKDDIAKRILRLYYSQQLYPMFVDQTISPTFIDDLAPAVKLLISKGGRGIFHLASPQPTTQYEFACYLIKTFGGNPNDVKQSSIKDFLKESGRTPRPINGGLDVGKINSLGFKLTNWQEGIEIIHKQSKGELI